MKQTHSFILLAALALPLGLGSAQAGVIVDTGPGPATDFGSFVGVFPLTGANQALAGEFNVGAKTSITDVRGWIGNANFGTAGDLTIALYGDAGGAPGSLLDSATVSVPANTHMGWLGVSSLGWAVTPGDNYWVAFQTAPGSTFLGLMNMPAANPLANYTYSADGGATWLGSSPVDFGVQIDGTGRTSVPDAGSTMTLMSLGIAGLGFLRRKI